MNRMIYVPKEKAVLWRLLDYIAILNITKDMTDYLKTKAIRSYIIRSEVQRYYTDEELNVIVAEKANLNGFTIAV